MNIYDISRQSGVSIATVSRVLNNSPHVSESTRERVLAAINSSGYVPNAFARGLGLNTMKTIGLLCPDASDPFLAAALSLLERAFRLHGYDCMLICTGMELKDRENGVEQLRKRHVDGMVLMGSSFVEDNERDNAYLREAALSVPMVLLNGDCAGTNIYSVRCDDEQALADAVHAAAEAGRKRILYLYNRNNYSGRSKLKGYCRGLSEAGLDADERLICPVDREKGTIPQVRDRLLELRDQGVSFDAAIVSEDRLAMGVLKYARTAGLSVPEELTVIGYNNSELCECCEPELTSVDNRLPAVCDQVVITMMGVLEGKEMPRATVFRAELVRRGSTPELH